MFHLNGNLLCAVDFETTGTVPGYNEIWQMCFMPLNADLEVHPDYPMFDCFVEIKHPSRIAKAVSKKAIMDVQGIAHSKEVTRELFEEWWTSLNLGQFKRIVMLAHNKKFEYMHSLFFFGWESWHDYFDTRLRCSLEMAQLLNDRANWANRDIPFPAATTLGALATAMDIDFDADGLHDAVYDCALTARVYKGLLCLP